MGKYITSIDLGSSKIAIATGCLTEAGIRIVSYREVPSTGIKNGEIINIFHVERTVSQLIGMAEEDIGEKIEQVILNVSAKFLHRETGTFSVHRTNPSGYISSEELESITKARHNTRNESGELLLEASPIKYSIDEYAGISFREAIGMTGNDIEAEFLMIFGKESLISFRRQILDKCGVAIKKFILSPIAAARAVLNETELENGVALVDIGKGTTDIAIIRDNVVLDIASIPFAGDSITNDIKNVANLTSKWAEEIKLQRGNCCPEIVPENSKLVFKNKDGISEGDMDLNLLTNIIEDRTVEILDTVRHILDSSKWSSKITSGVVITGGTAYLENIRQLAQAVLGRNVRLAAPRTSITNDSVESAFDAYSSVAVGLVLEGFTPKLSHADDITISKSAVENTEKWTIFNGLFGNEGNPDTAEPDGENDKKRRDEEKIRKVEEKKRKEEEEKKRKEEEKQRKEKEKQEKKEEKKRKQEEKQNRPSIFEGWFSNNTNDNA